MKWFSVILALVLGLGVARAEGPDDQYLTIYNLIQEADSLNSGGEYARALAKYREAQTALVQFQKGYPDWNSSVVSFRLRYVTAAADALAAKVPVPIVPGTNQPAAAQPAQPSANPAATNPAPPADWQNQLSSLGEQVRRLQDDKATLEAKLKEALSAQPGVLDPRQLARAEEKIKDLLKANTLLQVSLEDEKAKAASGADAQALEQARQALVRAGRDLDEQTRKANALEKEKTALQAKLDSLTPSSYNTAEIQATRTELEQAKRKLDEQTKLASDLAKEKEIIQAENESLRKQVAVVKSADQGSASARAQAQIADLEKARADLVRENQALQDQLKRASLEDTAKAGSAKDAQRARKLEKERDDLKKQLQAANKELKSRKSKTAAAHALETEQELAALRARLEVLEARQVPYTAEEAALFRVPESKPVEASPKAAAKASNELSPGTVALYADAKRYYSARQFDKAEDRYRQVLHEDENHVPSLANLAAIEIELNHLTQAESYILKALALAPDDPSCLAILGSLRFRQAKYDAALDALRRAATADPHNAEVQNYLGITLSAKGQRGPAETALRKAIQLEPHYADAHINLAVIYATQKPPLLELARWHYRRGLDAGGKPNPDLEKLLAPATSAAISP